MHNIPPQVHSHHTCSHIPYHKVRTDTPTVRNLANTKSSIQAWNLGKNQRRRYKEEVGRAIGKDALFTASHICKFDCHWLTPPPQVRCKARKGLGKRLTLGWRHLFSRGSAASEMHGRGTPPHSEVQGALEPASGACKGRGGALVNMLLHHPSHFTSAHDTTISIPHTHTPRIQLDACLLKACTNYLHVVILMHFYKITTAMLYVWSHISTKCNKPVKQWNNFILIHLLLLI